MVTAVLSWVYMPRFVGLFCYIYFYYYYYYYYYYYLYYSYYYYGIRLVYRLLVTVVPSCAYTPRFIGLFCCIIIIITIIFIITNIIIEFNWYVWPLPGHCFLSWVLRFVRPICIIKVRFTSTNI